MPAQYAHLGDRRYVNQDFVNGVQRLYPATTKKIPLGFSTYTGWGGKDEVLFTEQDPVPDVGLEGPVFQVTFPPDNPSAFEEGILAKVKHTTKSASAGPDRRVRLADAKPERWGAPLGLRREARSAGGTYGYARAVQASCEAAVRRLNKAATKLITGAASRDRAVLPFLQAHAERSSSLPARVLLAAYKATLPSQLLMATEIEKDAGVRRLGMYGYPVRTAKKGLALCAAMRENAGVLGAELHVRRAALHESITGFLGQHSEIGKCAASRLILSSYPAVDFKFRRAAETPTTVAGWLEHDLSR